MKRTASGFLLCAGLLLWVITQGGMAQVVLTASGCASTGGVSRVGPYTVEFAAGQPTPPGAAPGATVSLQGGLLYSMGAVTLLDHEGPLMSLYGFTVPTAGQGLTLDAQVSDLSGVLATTLVYRMGGAAGFDSVPMVKTGAVYEGAIPASDVTSRGLEFYLTSRDFAGNVSRLPSSGIYATRVRSLGAGVSNPAPQPGGTDQTAYRLISIPIDATVKAPSSVLADDLGAYDITKWRFFQLLTDQSNPDSLYTEYPATTGMYPGTAFWLIVRSDGKVITTGAGRSVITDRAYPIPLNPGWTFVGNPFNFEIPLANVTLKSNGILDMRTYSGSWSEISGGPLEPFQGYAVSNSGISYDTMFVNPVLTPVPAAQPAAPQSDAPAWSIRILARCQQAVARDTYIMASASASEGLDQLDKPEPPAIGEFISVSFPHPEWKAVFKNFSTDARPLSGNGGVWNMQVTSNIPDKVELAFEGVQSVPAALDVWLLDEPTKVSQSLRETDRYSYMNSPGAPPRRIRILVGTPEYIHEKLAATGSLPLAFDLFQNYPNPFNPTTTIRYALPVAMHVTLRVYTLTGQLLSTLLDGDEEVGFHSVLFEAASYPSGIYYYRLQAGSFTEVKKLLLVK